MVFDQSQTPKSIKIMLLLMNNNANLLINNATPRKTTAKNDKIMEKLYKPPADQGNNVVGSVLLPHNRWCSRPAVVSPLFPGWPSGKPCTNVIISTAANVEEENTDRTAQGQEKHAY